MTTNNVLFDANLRGLYPRFLKKKCKVSLLNLDEKASQIMLGYTMKCNTSWKVVDRVLFAIFMKKEKHWILGHFVIKDGIIHAYNSMGTSSMECAVLKALEPYSVQLPYFFNLVRF